MTTFSLRYCLETASPTTNAETDQATPYHPAEIPFPEKASCATPIVDAPPIASPVTVTATSGGRQLPARQKESFAILSQQPTGPDANQQKTSNVPDHDPQCDAHMPLLSRYPISSEVPSQTSSIGHSILDSNATTSAYKEIEHPLTEPCDSFIVTNVIKQADPTLWLEVARRGQPPP